MAESDSAVPSSSDCAAASDSGADDPAGSEAETAGGAVRGGGTHEGPAAATSEAVSADSSDSAAPGGGRPAEADDGATGPDEGITQSSMETTDGHIASSCSDARHSELLPDSSSPPGRPSAVSQSLILLSSSSSSSSSSSAGAAPAPEEVALADTTPCDPGAPTSSDLRSALRKIIESTIGSDILRGCVAVTSAGDDDDDDDDSCADGVTVMLCGSCEGGAGPSSEGDQRRFACPVDLSDGPTSTSADQSERPLLAVDRSGRLPAPLVDQSGTPMLLLERSGGSTLPADQSERSLPAADQSEQPAHASGRSPLPADQSEQPLLLTIDESEEPLSPSADQSQQPLLLTIGQSEEPLRPAADQSEQPLLLTIDQSEEPLRPASDQSEQLLLLTPADQSEQPMSRPGADRSEHPALLTIDQSEGSLRPAADQSEGSVGGDDAAAFGLLNLEDMMEVVVVRQFKCKLCPYKSQSRDNLINHMKERHLNPGVSQPPLKRGRGRPRKRPPSPEPPPRPPPRAPGVGGREGVARGGAAGPEADDDDDDIIDAGAIDDKDGDSDYNPLCDGSRGRQAPAASARPEAAAGDTDTRPRRRPGRPRKYPRLDAAPTIAAAAGTATTTTNAGAASNAAQLAAPEMTRAPPADAPASGPQVPPQSPPPPPPPPPPSVSHDAVEQAELPVNRKGGGAVAATAVPVEVVPCHVRGPGGGQPPPEEVEGGDGDESQVPRKRGRPPKRYARRGYRRYYSRYHHGYRASRPRLRPHCCGVCGSRFLSPEDLAFHEEAHDGPEPERFRCHHCNYHCKRWSSLKEHMYNHEGVKPYKCAECDYTSVYRKDVSRHASIHSKERPHVCDRCGRAFKRDAHLRNHAELHARGTGDAATAAAADTGVGNTVASDEAAAPANGAPGAAVYRCAECAEAFPAKKPYLEHRRSEHPPAPRTSEYPCPVCHRVYPMQKRLTQHLKTHSAEKPHMCDKCGKSFKKRYTFKMHLLTHIVSVGHSRYKCEHCDFVSDGKKSVLNHQLTHANDKPYKCDYCKYCTSREEFLIAHVAIRHTGEKPFSCDHCHFTTKHRKNLRLHVASRHADAFAAWVAGHPEEPPRHRRPFFSTQQIEELKRQHRRQQQQQQHGQEVAQEVAQQQQEQEQMQQQMQQSLEMQMQQDLDMQQQMHQLEDEEMEMEQRVEEPPLLCAEEPASDPAGSASLTFDPAEGGAPPPGGEAEGLDSAQVALDLLLNMSACRELVPGHSLQVPGGAAAAHNNIDDDDESARDAGDATPRLRQRGTNPAALPAGHHQRKVVTLHVDEHGGTVVQESYEGVGCGDAGASYEDGADGAGAQVVIGPYGVVSAQAAGLEGATALYGGGDGAGEVVAHTVVVSGADSALEKQNGVFLSAPDAHHTPHHLAQYGGEDSGPGAVGTDGTPVAPPAVGGGGAPGGSGGAAVASAAVKKFSCKLCSVAAFSGRAELEAHKRAHAGDRGFKCPHCGFQHAAWNIVRVHMLSHASLRPHKCDQCIFASKNKKDLRRHLLTHTNEKPFACDICGQRFNRNGHLKFHMDRLHGGGSGGDDKKLRTQTYLLTATDEAILQSLQAVQGTSVIDGATEDLSPDHIIVSQDPGVLEQEQAAFIQHITAEGHTIQQVVTADNQVQYIISQDGVQHLLPHECIVAVPDGHHIRVLQDAQVHHIQYEQEMQGGGHIEFVPLPEELEVAHAQLEEAAAAAAAHSAVSAVADAAMAQAQGVSAVETGAAGLPGHSARYEVIQGEVIAAYTAAQ